eukprot:TRINITY_DN40094_c0_g1_i1.p1 TRINITY_DN40094_c0_g1~~TRINITY_DN40094_c0_g1_i1.p1  ORF type:complete len:410 (-),score=88.92 TRINITY_DN40094_c0_g1_i1:246-1475(-)
MSETMTEQEIAEMQRLEAEAFRAAKRSLMNKASWDQFFQYFQFAEVSWLAQAFFARLCGREFLPKTDVQDATGEWVKHRWGHEQRGLEVTAIRPEIFEDACESAGISPKLENWDLPTMTCFVSYYQGLHLEKEPQAGFSKNDIKSFREVYDEYDKTAVAGGVGAGLRAKELFDILTDLGYEYSTVEEQKELVKMVKEADCDKSGTIDFREFLQLLRKITEKEKLANRTREHRLITTSGMTLEECEEWLDVFQITAGEEEALQFQDMKGLFEQIEVKWDNEGSKQMMAWLREVDEDANGEIDFGEFCCLVQKMWENDFAKIRQRSADAMANRIMTPRLLSKEDEDRSGPADGDESPGPTSPAPVRRRKSKSKIRRTWVSYVVDSADKDLSKDNPQRDEIIKQFHKALSHH